MPAGKYNVAHDTAIGGLITVSDIFGPPPLLFNSRNGSLRIRFGTPTIFTRTVKILNSADNMETKVNSIVRWTDKGEVKEVDLEDHFFNWRP